MKPRSLAGPALAEQQLRRGSALALQDLSDGRAELRDAAARFAAQGDARGLMLAAAMQLVFIGIADDDYTGFTQAIEHVEAGSRQAVGFDDAGDALLAEAGALIAGWFAALDAPALDARVATIAQALGNERIAASVRCCAGLAALGFYQARNDLESVLWLELTMRPIVADPGVGTRLAEEAHHMFVQALYECQAPAHAEALRARRALTPPTPLPAIELKLLLLDAQMALGGGRAEAGRIALARAEPLLQPRAPRPASWWHLLRSRLDLLEGRLRPALTHARLALRLGTQSCLPERWMGVTVMQEGHVLMASSAFREAVPFFERAGRAASGSQARFCWCLAHLARALDALAHDDAATGRAELSAGLGLARELAWLHFFRAGPQVAAAVCAAALDHAIEPAFVREVIAERGLQAVRPELEAWPWPIRVRALGALTISLDGQALALRGKAARKPLDLLLFIIASSGAAVSVDSAACALWRDLEGDKARAALNIALHRLRKLLADDAAVLLELGRLSLNPKRLWVDCLAFEHAVDSLGGADARALSATARAAAERALALYAGDFMNDAEDDAWKSVCRSRLASKCKRLVTLLAHAARARGDTAAVRAVLGRGLELDPLAEDLACELIGELIASGEHAAALATFARFRDAIAAAFGASPSAATAALVAPLGGPRTS
jgi:DNA-binding SARP family transcriptional activator